MPEPRGQARYAASFRWAVLGLVIERPSYGFELASRFERHFGDALTLNHKTQIYEALNRLEKNGLIESFHPQPAGARQPRPNYRVTEAGLNAYGERLASFASDARVQTGVFARELAAFAHRRPDAAVACLAACEQALLAESAVASIASGHEQDEPLDSVSMLAATFERQARTLTLEGKLSWVRAMRSACEALAPSEGPRPEPA